MKEKKVIIGSVSQEQIDAWKEKYGDLWELTVIDQDEIPHSCYLKKPSRKSIGYASVGSKTNPMKFNEILLKECWLGGDEDIKTDDDLFLAAAGQLADLIQIKEATLVKL